MTKTFNELRSEAKALGINTKGMSKNSIENAIARLTETVTEAEVEAAVTIEKEEEIDLAKIDAVLEAAKRPGRPVVQGSARQLRLAELEAKRAAGQLRRGRPTVEGSERQKRLAAIEAKRAAGIEIKPGRPKMTKVEEVPVAAPEMIDGAGI